MRAAGLCLTVEVDKLPEGMAYLVRRHDGLIFAKKASIDELQPTVPPNIDETARPGGRHRRNGSHERYARLPA